MRAGRMRVARCGGAGAKGESDGENGQDVFHSVVSSDVGLDYSPLFRGEVKQRVVGSIVKQVRTLQVFYTGCVQFVNVSDLQAVDR